MSSQFALLKTPRFGPFFWTQFFGAFNDNLFKNALVVLLTFHTAQWTSMQPEVLANMGNGIFILPFFLFSASAGQLADKFDKAMLTRRIKLFEIAIILLAALGFWLHHLIILMVCLFLFGLHSTLFGPVKYAILPQHLPEHELVGGNALIEAGTFVAILVGTITGGLIAGDAQGTLWVSLFCFATALIGYLFSRKVPAAPAPSPELKLNLNPISETWHNIGFARQNHTVFLAILGISWFWLFGALFLAQFPAFAKNVLGGEETSVSLLLAVFTLGIGLGSLFCERLSAGRVEIGLVPFGSIGLSVFCLDLALSASHLLPHEPLALMALIATPGYGRILFDLFAIGLFGGFFIVPLYALIQVRSNPAQRARIIAANNIVNALFMVVGSIAASLLLSRGMSIPMLFGLAGLCNALVAVYIYSLVPEFLLRFLLWLLIHSIYRLDKKGMEYIPDADAALLRYQPSSHIDNAIIIAACRRPVRCLVDQREWQSLLRRFILKQSKAIALDTSRPHLDAATKVAITHALAAGDLLALSQENPLAEEINALAQNVPHLDLHFFGLSASPFDRVPMPLSRRLSHLRFLRRVTISAQCGV